MTNHFRNKEWRSAKKDDGEQKKEGDQQPTNQAKDRKVAWKKPVANMVRTVPIEAASDSDSDSDDEYEDEFECEEVEKGPSRIVSTCDVDGNFSGIFGRSLGGPVLPARKSGKRRMPRVNVVIVPTDGTATDGIVPCDRVSVRAAGTVDRTSRIGNFGVRSGGRICSVERDELDIGALRTLDVNSAAT